MNFTTNKKETNELKVSFSVNGNIEKTDTKQSAATKTSGWKLTEVNWNNSDLTSFVRNNSYTCSTFKNEYRKKDNVESVYTIALDIDNKSTDESTTTLEEFKVLADKWQFCWFLHTTVSHRKLIKDQDGYEITGPDKFRVLIPFSKPVTRDFLAEEVRNHFTKMFSFLDESSFQGERYYFRSDDAETHMHNHTDEAGNSVFLNPEKIPAKTKNEMVTPTQKKKKTFPLDLMVLLADGISQKKISEIEDHTPIFCPFCNHDEQHRSNHEKANAFVDINDVGQYFIHCSSEVKTFWQDEAEIDPEKTKLFWNTSVGSPTAIEYETYEDIEPYYVFKNEKDFKNYCCEKKIDHQIQERLPRREIIFNPSLPSGLGELYYNVFEESFYLKKDYSGLEKISLDSTMEVLKKRCPVISEFLINLFGLEDYVKRFINWNAYILQSRRKAFTAWIISTLEQGVGKDFMFNFILKPIYGEKQSQLLNGSRIGDKFNTLDLRCWLRGFNEVFSSDGKSYNNSRKEWLKDKVTSREQTIEPKGVDQFQAKNFANFILFSNNSMPIYLDANDRRFNVIINKNARKVKDLPFYKSDKDFEEKVKSELGDFAEILFTLDFSAQMADETIDNDEKKRLATITADDYRKFAEALKHRDSDYFMLDDIFPVNNGLFNDRSNESIKAEEKIRDFGLIPASYMQKIVSAHFPNQNYRKNLDKLRINGLDTKSFNIGSIRLKGWYNYEEVTESN